MLMDSLGRLFNPDKLAKLLRPSSGVSAQHGWILFEHSLFASSWPCPLDDVLAPGLASKKALPGRLWMAGGVALEMALESGALMLNLTDKEWCERLLKGWLSFPSSSASSVDGVSSHGDAETSNSWHGMVKGRDSLISAVSSTSGPINISDMLDESASPRFEALHCPAIRFAERLELACFRAERLGSVYCRGRSKY